MCWGLQKPLRVFGFLFSFALLYNLVGGKDIKVPSWGFPAPRWESLNKLRLNMSNKNKTKPHLYGIGSAGVGMGVGAPGGNLARESKGNRGHITPTFGKQATVLQRTWPWLETSSMPEDHNPCPARVGSNWECLRLGRLHAELSQDIGWAFCTEGSG